MMGAPIRPHVCSVLSGADGKSELSVDVAGQRKFSVPLAPDVAYRPGEKKVMEFDRLAKAEAVRVVIPKQHTVEEMTNARWIKGLLE